MPSNDFLPFAAASGANVVPQSTYASMAALGPGYQTGIAESNQLNKTWRQASIIAAVLAQFIADVTGQNSVDDGTTSTLLTNLPSAIQACQFQVDQSSVANSYSLTYLPAASLTDGAVYSFRPNYSNTGASTLSINGSPAHAIVNQDNGALVGGELIANAMVTVIYTSVGTSFVLMSNAGGFQNGPTAAAGDSSTKLANTAFVTANGLGAQVIARVNSSGVIQHQNGPNTISVSHTGTGVYTITFGTAMPNANYAVIATTNSGFFTATEDPASLAAGSFIMQTFNSAGGSAADAGFNVAIFY